MTTPHRQELQLKLATALWQEGLERQLDGEVPEAKKLYRASLALRATPEAHTFLGWTYSFEGRLDEAISECRKAIEVDPDFGNPYNDIGVYLIDLGRPDEAPPWFEKAISSERYCCYQFPHFNLGRVLFMRGTSSGRGAPSSSPCGTIRTICPPGWPWSTSTRRSEGRCSRSFEDHETSVAAPSPATRPSVVAVIRPAPEV